MKYTVSAIPLERLKTNVSHTAKSAMPVRPTPSKKSGHQGLSELLWVAVVRYVVIHDCWEKKALHVELHCDSTTGSSHLVSPGDSYEPFSTADLTCIFCCSKL